MKPSFRQKRLLCTFASPFQFIQICLTSRHMQPTADMVPTEFLGSFRDSSSAVLLVDNPLYDVHRAMAIGVRVVCHLKRDPLVSCLLSARILKELNVRGSIPIGVIAFAMSFTGTLSRIINPKWIILFAETMLAVATILLAFADSPDKYWSHVFPAFILGSGGAMLAYSHTK